MYIMIDKNTLRNSIREKVPLQVFEQISSNLFFSCDCADFFPRILNFIILFDICFRSYFSINSLYDDINSIKCEWIDHAAESG